MKITRIEIIDARHPTAPGWNPVFVLVHTDTGLHGLGEMAPAYSGSLQAAIRHLQEHGPSLLGQDPFTIQAHTARILGGAWGQPCLTLGHVASALDIALHDLKGKALGVPVYDLLGGKVRDSVRCYANGWCYNLRTPEDYAQAALKVAAAGFTAMKFDPFRYAEGGFAWATQTPSAAPRTRWLKTAFDRVAAVRAAVGPEIDILLECHGQFDASTARLIDETARPNNSTGSRSPPIPATPPPSPAPPTSFPSPSPLANALSAATPSAPSSKPKPAPSSSRTSAWPGASLNAAPLPNTPATTAFS